MSKRNFLIGVLVSFFVFSAVLIPGLGGAADYPARPIQLICPWGAGGGMDRISRMVAVLLEHIDYLLMIKGEKAPFGYAAHSISRLEQPLSSMMGDLRVLRGVAEATEQIIREILKTGTSSYYEKLSAQYSRQ